MAAVFGKTGLWIRNQKIAVAVRATAKRNTAGDLPSRVATHLPTFSEWRAILPLLGSPDWPRSGRRCSTPWARGFTYGLVNVRPKRSVAVHAALEAGNDDGAGRVIEGMRPFKDIRAEEQNVAGGEAALFATGLDGGPTRPPSTGPLTVLQQDGLVRFLSGNGLVRARPAARR